MTSIAGFSDQLSSYPWGKDVLLTISALGFAMREVLKIYGQSPDQPPPKE